MPNTPTYGIPDQPSDSWGDIDAAPHLPGVTPQDARDAVAALGLIIEQFDGGDPPPLMNLFLACETSGITPPPELLEFIPDHVLTAFGYDLGYTTPQ